MTPAVYHGREARNQMNKQINMHLEIRESPHQVNFLSPFFRLDCAWSATLTGNCSFVTWLTCVVFYLLL